MNFIAWLCCAWLFVAVHVAVNHWLAAWWTPTSGCLMTYMLPSYQEVDDISLRHSCYSLERYIEGTANIGAGAIFTQASKLDSRCSFPASPQLTRTDADVKNISIRPECLRESQPVKPPFWTMCRCATGATALPTRQCWQQSTGAVHCSRGCSPRAPRLEPSRSRFVCCAFRGGAVRAGWQHTGRTGPIRCRSHALVTAKAWSRKDSCSCPLNG